MNRERYLNITAAVLAVLLLIVVIWGVTRDDTTSMEVEDGIEQMDLDTLYLKSSGVRVNFSEVILSKQGETRKLIVSTQTGTVTTQLTDQLISLVDLGILTKTQNVTYTGKGYFVVDLDHISAENIITNSSDNTVTIKIGHHYLQAIEIDPDEIIVDEVKQGLLNWGKIKLTVDDYKTIEQELRSRLEETFNTVANGQEADDKALKMVKEVFEPLVKAIDRRYRVIVEFKS